MNIEHELNSKTIRSICDYFIGDVYSIFRQRSQSEIISWLNMKFDEYIHLEYSKLSRWYVFNTVMTKMAELDRLSYFFDTMLSYDNVRTDNFSKTPKEIADLRKEGIEKINGFIAHDNYELIEASGTLYFYKKIDKNNFLGEGGFARVYRIPHTNKVIKRLKDEFKGNDEIVSRFKYEYSLITGTLSNIDGIVKAYELDEHEIAYTMEYYACNLKDYVLNNYLPDGQKDKLILDILEIMNGVHKRNVLHRDLSPKNIFIKDSKPIIADFGLGKAIDGSGRTYVTSDTSYQGTLEYCDPRQFQGLKFANYQSDIYSLAKIINFIMTKNPSDFKHKYEFVTQIATLESLDARYHSIEEMIGKIKQIQKGNAYVISSELMDKLTNGIYVKQMDDYLLLFEGEELIKKMYSYNFCRVYFCLFNNPQLDKILIEKVSSMHTRLESGFGLQFNALDPLGISLIDLLVKNKIISPGIKEEVGKCVHDITCGIGRFKVQDYFVEKYKLIDPIYIDETIRDFKDSGSLN